MFISAEDENRVRDELDHIRSLIQAETSLVSRWNGTLVIAPYDAPYRGLKPFGCDIHLRADLVNDPIRWRTLIHEMLHSVSADYNQVDYNTYKGWEEGVVEKLQRLLRGRVLAALNVSVQEELFLVVEKIALFNEYIVALEQVRLALEVESEPLFYVSLLRTPLRHRYASLVQQAMTFPTSQRRQALDALSKARVVLEKRA